MHIYGKDQLKVNPSLRFVFFSHAPFPKPGLYSCTTVTIWPACLKFVQKAQKRRGKTCCEREGGWCESPVEKQKAGVIFSVGPALKPLRAALFLWRCRPGGVWDSLDFPQQCAERPGTRRWTGEGWASLSALFVDGQKEFGRFTRRP